MQQTADAFHHAWVPPTPLIDKVQIRLKELRLVGGHVATKSACSVSERVSGGQVPTAAAEELGILSVA
jgi:hypothetical protein